jgi:hypothetical protein
MDQVGLVRRQSWRIAPELNAVVARREPDTHFINQSHCLHDRPEVVVTIGTAIKNAEDEIDFGGSENGEFTGR